MARKSEENLVQLTGTVNETLRESVEAHRWQHRQTVADVVREAVTEWADKRGYPTAPSAPEAKAAPEVEAAPTTAKVRTKA